MEGLGVGAAWRSEDIDDEHAEDDSERGEGSHEELPAT